MITVKNLWKEGKNGLRTSMTHHTKFEQSKYLEDELHSKLVNPNLIKDLTITFLLLHSLFFILIILIP